MEVGSLVITLKYPSDFKNGLIHCNFMTINWLPVDDESTIYTVKELTNNSGDNEPCLRLEEGIIGKNLINGLELALPVTWFKEIQPPMELNELMKKINEKELFSI